MVGRGRGWRTGPLSPFHGVCRSVWKNHRGKDTSLPKREMAVKNRDGNVTKPHLSNCTAVILEAQVKRGGGHSR